MSDCALQDRSNGRSLWEDFSQHTSTFRLETADVGAGHEDPNEFREIGLQDFLAVDGDVLPYIDHDPVSKSRESFLQSRSVLNSLHLETNSRAFGADSVKSSPCSPTLSFLANEELGVSRPPRQRSYSDGEDKLNPQDRACLEEIERGSQLTREDQELFDLLSKKKIESDSLGDIYLGAETKEHDAKRSVQSQFGRTNDSKPGSSALKQLLLTNTKNQNGNRIKVSYINDAQSKGQIRRIVSPPTGKLLNLPNSRNKTVGSDNALKSNSVDTSSSNQTVVNGQATDAKVTSIVTASAANHSSSSQLKLILPPGVVYKDGKLIFPSTQQQPTAAEERKQQPVLLREKTPEKTSPASAVSALKLTPVTVESPRGEKGATIESLYCCEECGRTFAKPSLLKTHVMEKHTGERPYKCDFPGCTWAFSANYKLDRHKECHKKKKASMCPIEGCGKLFSNVYNLNQHMRLHKRSRDFSCEACGMKFGTQKKLDVHMKIHGDAYKNYKCPVASCEKRFFSELSMGSHMKIHERDRVLPCTFPGCDKVFEMQCKLTAHIRTHTGERPFSCPYSLCNASFTNSSHLTRHLRVHNNKRDFVCHLCNKGFLRQEHLRSHLTSHTGLRPFMCTYPNCGARFSAKSTLSMHMKRHPRTDSEPSTCPLEGCSQQFTDKTAFRQHIDCHFAKQASMSITQNPAALVLPTSLFNTTTSADAQLGLVSCFPTSTTPVVSAPTTKPRIVLGKKSTILRTSTLPNLKNLMSDMDPLVLMPPPASSSMLITPSQAATLASAPVTQPANTTMSFLNVAVSGVSALGPVMLTPELAHSLIAASGVSMVSNEMMAPEHAQEMIKSGQDVVTQASIELKAIGSEYGDSAESAGAHGGEECGCARTDSVRNQQMTLRIHKRRIILKQKAAQAGMDLGSYQELASEFKLASNSYITENGLMASPHEVMTSRALTIRDPETGALYLQTQLLQDDPPNPDFEEVGGNVVKEESRSLLRDTVSSLRTSSATTPRTQPSQLSLNVNHSSSCEDLESILIITNNMDNTVTTSSLADTAIPMDSCVIFSDIADASADFCDVNDTNTAVEQLMDVPGNGVKVEPKTENTEMDTDESGAPTVMFPNGDVVKLEGSMPQLVTLSDGSQHLISFDSETQQFVTYTGSEAAEMLQKQSSENTGAIG